jgi:hypothetical protein
MQYPGNREKLRAVLAVLKCPTTLSTRVTFNDSTEGLFHDSSNHPTTSPPLCFHHHGKPLRVLRHDGQWWLHSNDVLAVTGRRLGRWQHSHGLLTLDYTPDHPLRHAMAVCRG